MCMCSVIIECSLLLLTENLSRKLYRKYNEMQHDSSHFDEQQCCITDFGSMPSETFDRQMKQYLVL